VWDDKPALSGGDKVFDLSVHGVEKVQIKHERDWIKIHIEGIDNITGAKTENDIVLFQKLIHPEVIQIESDEDISGFKHVIKKVEEGESNG
jgi:hypothetical protein